jgi:hypothetical protein
VAIGRAYWIYEVGNSNIYIVVLECWYVVVIQLTVDVGNVEDWHMKKVDLGGIDLNTQNLEIFSKQTFSAG